MKKIDLGILDNADDDIIEKLPPFSSDEETRKRVLSMSEKKFDDLMNEKNKENANEYAISVSGVEKYRRPVWHKALGIAAAIAVIAGGIGTATVLKNRSPKSSNSMLAANTTEQQLTTESPTSEIPTEPPVQALVPTIDIKNDTVRFMAPEYAPYLLDISEEQQQKLAAALDSSEWTPCDPDIPISNGEAYTMYVYNNGASYSLTLCGDNIVKFEYESTKTPWNCVPVEIAEPIGVTSYWHVPAETAKAIEEAAYPEAEIVRTGEAAALSGHLTWCDISSLSVEDIWKNTRVGAKECDMTDKKDIFYKMNNTIDYFDKASGVIKQGGFGYTGYGTMTVSTFQVDLNTAEAYQFDENYYGYGYENLIAPGESVTTDDMKVIVSQDGECRYSIDLSEGKYDKMDGVVHRIDSPAVPFEELHPKDDSITEYDNWNSRRQMLGGIAVSCIENYRMAVDYLQDYSKWDIVGTEEFGGRSCIHIKGTYDVEYDEVKSFDLYVDEATGVTVKMNGYDANGELISFILVENLKFDDDAEPVAKPDLTGLTERYFIPRKADGSLIAADDTGVPQEALTEAAPVIDIPADAEE